MQRQFNAAAGGNAAQRVDLGLEPLAAPLPAELDPVAIYIESLGTTRARITAKSNLNAVAKLAGHPLNQMPFGALRWQHVQVIRAHLCEAYTTTTVNGILNGLRRTARAAYELGMMSAHDLERVVEVRRVRDQELAVSRRNGLPTRVSASGLRTMEKDDREARVEALLRAAAMELGFRRALEILRMEHDRILSMIAR